MEDEPSVFTDKQIAEFLKLITDPEERAEKEALLRKFAEDAARMNAGLPLIPEAVVVFKEEKGEHNG